MKENNLDNIGRKIYKNFLNNMSKEKNKECCEKCFDELYWGNDKQGCTNPNCECHNSLEQEEKWDMEKEFDKRFPRDLREVYVQGDGSASSGVVKMKPVIKDFIHLSNQKMIEQAIDLINKNDDIDQTLPSVKNLLTILNSLLK
jgi:hypothetical protein